MIKALKAKIAELKEDENQAREAKDYPMCIIQYGAIIHFERFLAEMEERVKVK